jgi:hypothetical protein
MYHAQVYLAIYKKKNVILENIYPLLLYKNLIEVAANLCLNGFNFF